MDSAQKKFLLNLCEINPDAVIIGSIGSICYDLKDIPHKNKILVKGFMGGAISIGLGYALGNPDKKVIVVIGDGSYLMKLGSIVTVGKYNPGNLDIFVVKNGTYASCGGQRTCFDGWGKFNPHIFDVESVPADFV